MVLAATHCFGASLIDTVIVKNVNPIEKLERSSLIIAETVQAVQAPLLARPQEHARISQFSAPALLPAPEPAPEAGAGLVEM